MLLSAGSSLPVQPPSRAWTMDEGPSALGRYDPVSTGRGRTDGSRADRLSRLSGTGTLGPW